MIRTIFAFAATLAINVSTVPVAQSKALTFSDDCAHGDKIVVAAVGDLIFHNTLMRRAFWKRSGFQQFWKPLGDVLAGADMTYGNLEGPVAEDVAAWGRRARDPGWRMDYRVYGYKLPTLSFNFHPAVLRDLKASGFDVISTANNHALDRGRAGVERTIENFGKAGLAYAGTRSQSRRFAPWSRLVSANGFRIAWLACTFTTNGIRDRGGQVLYCLKDRQELLTEIGRLSSRQDVDAIVVTPHWGEENWQKPTRSQRRFARDVLDAGALAVIGSHPHVLQPVEKYTTAEGREGVIAYSLGNFVSNQRRLPQRAGAVLLLEIARRAGEKARLTGAGYIPTWVEIDRRGVRATEAKAKSWAARHAARVLPAGNRVTASDFRNFPRVCPAVSGLSDEAGSAMP